MTATTYADTANPILDTLKAAPAWDKLSPSEQTGVIAIASRLASMVTEYATPKDWSQIIGYAEWAKRPRVKLSEATLDGAIVHGAWRDWAGGVCPVHVGIRVEVRLRCGVQAQPQPAGYWSWSHTNENGDIVAYRIAD